MLSTIVSGEADLADVLFLIAFILFIITAVTRAMARNTDGLLVSAGATAIALAWLCL
jgi:hypothetical protein